MYVSKELAQDVEDYAERLDTLFYTLKQVYYLNDLNQ